MRKSIISLSFLSIFAVTPVLASSLPVAEIEQKIGLSWGPSFSADFKLSSNSSLGFSFGIPTTHGVIIGTGFGFNSGRYDVRFLYKFLQQDNFSLSGLLGIAGGTTFGTTFGFTSGIEAGIALSYEFIPKLTGRLNLVAGLPFIGLQDYWGYFAPAGGFELGYKFTDNIEGTIGGNGQFDFIGVNISF